MKFKNQAEATLFAGVAHEINALRRRIEDVAKPEAQGLIPGLPENTCFGALANGIAEDLVDASMIVVAKIPDRVQAAIVCFLNSNTPNQTRSQSLGIQSEIASAQATFSLAYIRCITTMVACLAGKKGWDRLPCILNMLGCLAAQLESDGVFDGIGGGGGANSPSGYIPPQPRSDCG